MTRYALISVVLLLGACQTPNTHDLEERKSRALAELAKLRYPAAVAAETVQYADDFFVPALDETLQQEPVWYSKEVQVEVTAMPLDSLLASVFTDQYVTSAFADPNLAEQEVSLVFKGYRGDLIKAIANHLNWHVEYDDQQLRWSRWQTMEFDVAFIAGASEYFMGNKDTTRQVANDGQGMPSGGTPQRSSEQYSNFRNERLSVWDDLARTLKLLVSEHGVVSLNQSSTSVVVRDTPYHVQAVASYLRQQNERLTRQVAIEVQIIEVNFNDEQQLGIDWQALTQTAGGNAVLGLGAGGGALADALGGQLFWQRQSGRAAGSELFIQALEQQGLVTINNQPRVVSLNNQIAKIALQDNATYLASAGTTSTVNVGATTTLQPGVVTTGFELYLLPSIREGEVILQLSTELSDLQRIDEVRSGDQLIQTPHTNRKQFFMQAAVADGQTLLLSGLRNQRSQLQAQQSWLSIMLGGQQLEQQRHSETLVLLTPTIVTRGNG
ncbi:hypothetical protein [Pseudidiomarina sp. CB1]|uniref:hypothetical protein n=1 Tax=Pseudidiomarina sp. CB1 TaxID=2972484 RepID=UPI00216270D6|nr:hypothetical protein [Pseudidiomarina sp. CB1]